MDPCGSDGMGGWLRDGGRALETPDGGSQDDANNRLSGQSRGGTVADVPQHRTFAMMRPLPGPVSHAPL